MSLPMPYGVFMGLRKNTFIGISAQYSGVVGFSFCLACMMPYGLFFSAHRLGNIHNPGAGQAVDAAPNRIAPGSRGWARLIFERPQRDPGNPAVGRMTLKRRRHIYFNGLQQIDNLWSCRATFAASPPASPLLAWLRKKAPAGPDGFQRRKSLVAANGGLGAFWRGSRTAVGNIDGKNFFAFSCKQPHGSTHADDIVVRMGGNDQYGLRCSRMLPEIAPFPIATKSKGSSLFISS